MAALPPDDSPTGRDSPVGGGGANISGMETSYTGKLLVATPKLDDPNFARTVVLMLAHDENGALGVVLNRPLEASVDAALPGWSALVEPPAVLFQGGPVEPDTALAVARMVSDREAAGFTPLTGRMGLLDVSRGPEGLPIDDVEALRVFGGYAGWGNGQLDQEIAQEAWFVVDSEAHDPFAPDPANLWRDVLRRQPGRLAMFAFAPRDARQN